MCVTIKKMDIQNFIKEIENFIKGYGRSNIIFKKDLNNFIDEIKEKIDDETKNGKEKEGQN